MQFLFEVSKEFGTTPGFSIIKGKVVPIPTQTDSNQLRRVPHVGWASLNIDNTDCPLLKNLMGTDSFYFVHSFMCSPVNPSVVASNVDYLGQKITASLSHKNIFGTQFHPEKSGKSGLKVLKNFIDL
jgi:glutamine amidotransferase